VFVAEIMATTETFLGGKKIAKRLGVVYGISVYSRTDIGDWIGSIKAAFGGKQGGFAKMIEKNRNDALNSMMIQAEELGADAVIGVRFDSNEFEVNGKAMSEVVAYGTAVVFEDEEEMGQ
jgi:uncharacterized protein YbjQ (UPF0145 family)